MKIEMYCRTCEKVVRVDKIYIAKCGALNLYFQCGHSNHDFELTPRKSVEAKAV